MNCKQCGKELESKVNGHRTREYCNAACRQAHYRKQHAAIVATNDTPSPELASVTRELGEARERIEELATEVMRLRNRLDLEVRYHTDTKPYSFPSWIRKQPKTSLSEKLLGEPLLPGRGSRGLYEAHVRRLHCSPEETAEFEHLWKAMLLQS